MAKGFVSRGCERRQFLGLIDSRTERQLAGVTYTLNEFARSRRLQVLSSASVYEGFTYRLLFAKIGLSKRKTLLHALDPASRSRVEALHEEVRDALAVDKRKAVYPQIDYAPMPFGPSKPREVGLLEEKDAQLASSLAGSSQGKCISLASVIEAMVYLRLIEKMEGGFDSFREIVGSEVPALVRLVEYVSQLYQTHLHTAESRKSLFFKSFVADPQKAE